MFDGTIIEIENLDELKLEIKRLYEARIAYNDEYYAYFSDESIPLEERAEEFFSGKPLNKLLYESLTRESQEDAFSEAISDFQNWNKQIRAQMRLLEGIKDFNGIIHLYIHNLVENTMAIEDTKLASSDEAMSHFSVLSLNSFIGNAILGHVSKTQKFILELFDCMDIKSPLEQATGESRTFHFNQDETCWPNNTKLHTELALCYTQVALKISQRVEQFFPSAKLQKDDWLVGSAAKPTATGQRNLKLYQQVKELLYHFTPQALEARYQEMFPAQSLTLVLSDIESRTNIARVIDSQLRNILKLFSETTGLLEGYIGQIDALCQQSMTRPQVQSKPRGKPKKGSAKKRRARPKRKSNPGQGAGAGAGAGQAGNALSADETGIQVNIRRVLDLSAAGTTVPQATPLTVGAADSASPAADDGKSELRGSGAVDTNPSAASASAAASAAAASAAASEPVAALTAQFDKLRVGGESSKLRQALENFDNKRNRVTWAELPGLVETLGGSLEESGSGSFHYKLVIPNEQGKPAAMAFINRRHRKGRLDTDLSEVAMQSIGGALTTSGIFAAHGIDAHIMQPASVRRLGAARA